MGEASENLEVKTRENDNAEIFFLIENANDHQAFRNQVGGLESLLYPGHAKLF